jgi:outer membrane protein OmpA-like peptidoglycan-associated protein
MVVLVPDPDGKTGRITVANQAGSTTIESPNQGTIIQDSKSQPSSPANMEKETIESIFSEALSIQPKRPVHFILYFEKDVVLTSDSLRLMTDILTAIRDQDATDISVIGHADTVGSKELNFTLSKNRANSIRDLLVEKGVNVSYINTTSHGKENPLIKTDDNVNEPRNRRVEVIIR